uniref:Uncharacterized protein n=1 Tax=Chromera velia CCMP2878 TaxID=1169474 RepID=A0A0G4HNQ5_9ALVE|eukprot:Cvel_7643.t1-p1 / transcript=Cvel_7643.t1 / gene=Cvel_7643 / organism=Chromera_velia_CCMP2878 / gene_product=hypothetical protein / transcript_product=hypothetical protein / location=Cvel_scaffold404:25196-29822(+) / protein_length=1396 / sequence_SO=supercontig / SO=protein_coding / is_pseudo=false
MEAEDTMTLHSESGRVYTQPRPRPSYSTREVCLRRHFTDQTMSGSPTPPQQRRSIASACAFPLNANDANDAQQRDRRSSDNSAGEVHDIYGSQTNGEEHRKDSNGQPYAPPTGPLPSSFPSADPSKSNQRRSSQPSLPPVKEEEGKTNLHGGGGGRRSSIGPVPLSAQAGLDGGDKGLGPQLHGRTGPPSGRPPRRTGTGESQPMQANSKSGSSLSVSGLSISQLDGPAETHHTNPNKQNTLSAPDSPDVPRDGHTDATRGSASSPPPLPNSFPVPHPPGTSPSNRRSSAPTWGGGRDAEKEREREREKLAGRRMSQPAYDPPGGEPSRIRPPPMMPRRSSASPPQPPPLEPPQLIPSPSASHVHSRSPTHGQGPAGTAAARRSSHTAGPVSLSGHLIQINRSRSSSSLPLALTNALARGGGGQGSGVGGGTGVDGRSGSLGVLLRGSQGFSGAAPSGLYPGATGTGVNGKSERGLDGTAGQGGGGGGGGGDFSPGLPVSQALSLPSDGRSLPFPPHSFTTDPGYPFSSSLGGGLGEGEGGHPMKRAGSIWRRGQAGASSSANPPNPHDMMSYPSGPSAASAPSHIHVNPDPNAPPMPNPPSPFQIPIPTAVPLSSPGRGGGHEHNGDGQGGWYVDASGVCGGGDASRGGNATDLRGARGGGVGGGGMEEDGSQDELINRLLVRLLQLDQKMRILEGQQGGGGGMGRHSGKGGGSSSSRLESRREGGTGGGGGRGGGGGGDGSTEALLAALALELKELSSQASPVEVQDQLETLLSRVRAKLGMRGGDTWSRGADLSHAVLIPWLKRERRNEKNKNAQTDRAVTGNAVSSSSLVIVVAEGQKRNETPAVCDGERRETNERADMISRSAPDTDLDKVTEILSGPPYDVRTESDERRPSLGIGKQRERPCSPLQASEESSFEPASGAATEAEQSALPSRRRTEETERSAPAAGGTVSDDPLPRSLPSPSLPPAESPSPEPEGNEREKRKARGAVSEDMKEAPPRGSKVGVGGKETAAGGVPLRLPLQAGVRGDVAPLRPALRIRSDGSPSPSNSPSEKGLKGSWKEVRVVGGPPNQNNRGSIRIAKGSPPLVLHGQGHVVKEGAGGRLHRGSFGITSPLPNPVSFAFTSNPGSTFALQPGVPFLNQQPVQIQGIIQPQQQLSPVPQALHNRLPGPVQHIQMPSPQPPPQVVPLQPSRIHPTSPPMQQQMAIPQQSPLVAFPQSSLSPHRRLSAAPPQVPPPLQAGLPSHSPPPLRPPGNPKAPSPPLQVSPGPSNVTGVIYGTCAGTPRPGPGKRPPRPPAGRTSLPGAQGHPMTPPGVSPPPLAPTVTVSPPPGALHPSPVQAHVHPPMPTFAPPLRTRSTPSPSPPHPAVQGGPLMYDHSFSKAFRLHPSPPHRVA